MLQGLSIKSRLMFVIAFLCLLLIGTGIFGLNSLNRVNASLKTVYENRLVSMGQLDLMVRALNRLRYSVASAADDTSPDAIDAKLARLKEDLAEGDLGGQFVVHGGGMRAQDRHVEDAVVLQGRVLDAVLDADGSRELGHRRLEVADRHHLGGIDGLELSPALRQQ